MPLWRSKALAVGLLSLLATPVFTQVTNGPLPRGRISIKESDILGDPHIVGFTIVLEHGTFSGVSELPENWKFTIDNAVSGSSTLEAHSNDHRYWITAHRFENIDLEASVGTNSMGHADAYGNIVVLSSGETERILPFSSWSFRFTEAFIRRRLPLH
jgi:hypothetical protein